MIKIIKNKPVKIMYHGGLGGGGLSPNMNKPNKHFDFIEIKFVLI